MNIAGKKPGRRAFLLAVGASGGAAIAAVASKTVPEKATPTAKTDDQSKGYQLSEHVRKYYRSTLV